MTNTTHSVLYIGVTADLVKRVWEHKSKTSPTSFTAKYNCLKLVYHCFYPRIEEAIAAEKSLKKRLRSYKQTLITGFNPAWKDLYQDILE